MEMGIMLVVVVVLLGAWFTAGRMRWKTLLTATGPNAGELEAKYEHLKSNNVKCKLEAEAGPALGNGFVQNGILPDSAGSVVRLKVHEAQVEQAKELLEQFPESG